MMDNQSLIEVMDAFGPPQDKQLVLLYNNQHYDVVTRLPGFFGTNRMITKVNTLIPIIQTTVQPVFKTSAPNTGKPKVRGIQPLFHVTGVNKNSLGRPVFYNMGASLTRAS